jgi:hypothetical protein
MNQFHSQATHNQDFLDCIESTYPDNFFDWKITVTFYITIHLLKALAIQRGCLIGESHDEIFRSLDQRRGKPVMQFPPAMLSIYKNIYRYSRTSRYNGITDYDLTLTALKNDYLEVIKLKESFLSYMKGQGIVV